MCLKTFIKKIECWRNTGEWHVTLNWESEQLPEGGGQKRALWKCAQQLREYEQEVRAEKGIPTGITTCAMTWRQERAECVHIRVKGAGKGRSYMWGDGVVGCVPSQAAGIFPEESRELGEVQARGWLGQPRYVEKQKSFKFKALNCSFNPYFFAWRMAGFFCTCLRECHFGYLLFLLSKFVFP